MSPAATRRLLGLHRWAGLVLSLNVLVFALTGVVLIFHEEIEAVLEPPALPAGPTRPPLKLVQAIAVAKAKAPGADAVYVSREVEHPEQVYVGLGHGTRKLEETKAIKVDLASGRTNDTDFDDTFIGVVFHLHADLMAGPVGALVVGAIGFALFFTLVTGALIYGPMMKRFAFGTLRRDKHRRNLLADFHKLVGVSVFGWLALVVATGVLLSIGSILIQVYAQNELRALAKVDAAQPLVDGSSVIDTAVAAAEASSGGRKWTIAILPGSDLSSPRHFSILMSGAQGIEKRLLRISLVDAERPTSASYHDFPLYLKAVLVSEPLHFGDYGGLPLKLVWAVFTLGLIALSGSGVYTFFGGRKGARDKVWQPEPTTATEEAS